MGTCFKVLNREVTESELDFHSTTLAAVLRIHSAARRWEHV